MNVFIDRDNVTIPLIPEQPTGQQFLKVLNSFYYKEIGESKKEIPIALFVTIRTWTTNKVFTVPSADLVDLGFRENIIQLSDLSGYYLTVATVQKILENNLNFSFKNAMPTSVLQPIGFIDSQGKLSICFQIIVEDKYENGTFILSDVHKSGTFEDISSVLTFTNLTSWSKMILPTLKIVAK
jgi:hypothetical protein